MIIFTGPGRAQVFPKPRLFYLPMKRLLSYVLPLLLPFAVHAQTPAPQSGPTGTSPKIRDLKVLEEYSDGKGNIVRKIQYSQGMMKVTEMIVMPKPPKMDLNVSVRPDTLRKDSVRVVVDKSDYLCSVYYRGRCIRRYRAVFGPRPMENKLREGDRCTPEGWFTIQRMNPASQYNKFMLLSYPNDDARKRFAQAQAAGLIPASARIGGDVGIHGIWPRGDDMIDLGVGWTDGCVALRNKDVDELFSLVGVGTRVYIQK